MTCNYFVILHRNARLVNNTENRQCYVNNPLFTVNSLEKITSSQFVNKMEEAAGSSGFGASDEANLVQLLYNF